MKAKTKSRAGEGFMIRVRCPDCRREYSFKDSRAGTSIECLTCYYTFRIPFKRGQKPPSFLSRLLSGPLALSLGFLVFLGALGAWLAYSASFSHEGANRLFWFGLIVAMFAFLWILVVAAKEKAEFGAVAFVLFLPLVLMARRFFILHRSPSLALFPSALLYWSAVAACIYGFRMHHTLEPNNPSWSLFSQAQVVEHVPNAVPGPSPPVANPSSAPMPAPITLPSPPPAPAPAAPPPTPVANPNPPPRAPSARKPPLGPEVDPALLQPGFVVMLAEMQERNVQMGPWRFGKGELGDPARTPIQVTGSVSPHGLSMYPPAVGKASVTYALGKKAQKFMAMVALADNSRNPPPISSVIFQVIGDGKSLWQSQPVRAPKQLQNCNVDVTDVAMLELRVWAAGSNEECRAVWIQPRIVKDVPPSAGSK